MLDTFYPEGELLSTGENRAVFSSVRTMESAMNDEKIVEGLATLCDENMRLHVDCFGIHGIIEVHEALYVRPGEERKDIAVITRVGKPISAVITGIELQNGVPFLQLSRRRAQKKCLEALLKTLSTGDILNARVTHLEPFGAFVDIGCGIPSLLSVDCISVSRISHPRDRLHVGMKLPVIVKSIHEGMSRIYVSLRELLGTWEENAAAFEVGQTVSGIVRSVESYGVFVELSPNLAGLCEVREEVAKELKEKIGCRVAVYIKSIIPERMKVKLVLIDTDGHAPQAEPLRFFLPTDDHMDLWRYSPSFSSKVIETRFCE